MHIVLRELDITMKTIVLVLLVCVVHADDIRWEFQEFKSQLENEYTGDVYLFFMYFLDTL